MTAPVYDSAARGFLIVEEIRELFRFREFLRLVILHSVAKRYKRSVLGVVWTLLNPLATMAVLTLVFSTAFGSSLQRYPVYLLSGIIFWQFFSQTTVQATHSLVWGSSLLKRIYVPRSVFVVAAAGSGLVNLIVSVLMLIVIMAILRQPFYATWWFLPIAVFLLAIFTLGVGLFVSALAVQFTDVVDMYQMAIQILFWFTPIMYPKIVLPAEYAWMINLNPLPECTDKN
jgi:ABC-type polysaccharide/polyol phosphate export permease